MINKRLRKLPRMLITGGGSYLGRALVLRAAAAFDVTYTYFQQDPWVHPYGAMLDVRLETAVHSLVRAVQPEVIIHTVGSNRGAHMEAVIRQGTAHVVAAAGAVGARLIHISTDSIFRGDQAPYTESAAPDPVNAYGAAKAAAEQIVRRLHNAVIVRTSLIYDLQRMDHGTRWMAAALQRGEPVTLFANQLRNPVWTETLTAACLELSGHHYTGILNVAGRQELSRAAFAQKMLAWWQVPNRHLVQIADAAPGEWPLDCRLDLTRAASLLQTPLAGVDERLSAAE